MSAAEDEEFLDSQTITIKHSDGRLLQASAYITVDGEEVAVIDTVPIKEIATAEEMADPGRTILKLVVEELISRLKTAPWDFKAADFEFVRKLSADNSVTLAQVRRGEFGAVAQRAAEEFPFPGESETPFPSKAPH